MIIKIKHRKTVWCLLFFGFFANSLFSQQINPESDNTKEKIFRFQFTLEKWKEEITPDIAKILAVYNYNLKQPLPFRNTPWMTMKLADIAIIQPEYKIPELDGITKMSMEAIPFVRKYNSDGSLAEEMSVAEELGNINLFNKNYKKAIEHYISSNNWARKYIDQHVRKKYTEAIGNRDEAQIIFKNTRVEIIKELIARKQGSKHNVSSELFSRWKKNKFYEWPGPLQMYLGFLIVFNRTKEFKEVVLFDFNRGTDYNSLFYCKEISNIYFEWFDMHTYWLTDDFKVLLKELRKEVLAKTPACYEQTQK